MNHPEMNRPYTLTQTTVEVAVDKGSVSVPAKVILELSPRPKVVLVRWTPSVGQD